MENEMTKASILAFALAGLMLGTVGGSAAASLSETLQIKPEISFFKGDLAKALIKWKIKTKKKKLVMVQEVMEGPSPNQSGGGAPHPLPKPVYNPIERL
jgi:hypothetical protein